METKHTPEMPRWKTVACPTCKQPAGSSCGRYARDVPWVWVTTKPHARRIDEVAISARALGK